MEQAWTKGLMMEAEEDKTLDVRCNEQVHVKQFSAWKSHPLRLHATKPK